MEFIQPPPSIPHNARTIYEALRAAKEEAIEICRRQSEILLRDASSYRSEEERIAELERMDRAYDKARRLIRYLKEKYEDVRVQIFKNPKASAPVFNVQEPYLRNRIPTRISGHSNARRGSRAPDDKKIPILMELAGSPTLPSGKRLNKVDLAFLRRCMQKVDYLEDPRLKKYRFQVTAGV